MPDPDPDVHFQATWFGPGICVPLTGGVGLRHVILNLFQVLFIKRAIEPDAEPQLVQKTINPDSGLTMAYICAEVILGTSTPFVVELTSSAALPPGGELLVFMATAPFRMVLPVPLGVRVMF